MTPFACRPLRMCILAARACCICPPGRRSRRRYKRCHRSTLDRSGRRSGGSLASCPQLPIGRHRRVATAGTRPGSTSQDTHRERLLHPGANGGRDRIYRSHDRRETCSPASSGTPPRACRLDSSRAGPLPTDRYRSCSREPNRRPGVPSRRRRNLPCGVPYIKRNLAPSGQIVCGEKATITVDGIKIDAARERDRRARALPSGKVVARSTKAKSSYELGRARVP